MRVVVFDRELHEALTVVEVPQKLFEEGKQRGRRIYMVAMKPISALGPASEAPSLDGVSAVALELQPVFQGARPNSAILFWYAYTDNPEMTLLLRAAFLPGQVGELKQREALAFIRGAFGFAPP